MWSPAASTAPSLATAKALASEMTQKPLPLGLKAIW
jgi:hypothetical protein